MRATYFHAGCSELKGTLGTEIRALASKETACRPPLNQACPQQSELDGDSRGWEIFLKGT